MKKLELYLLLKYSNKFKMGGVAIFDIEAVHKKINNACKSEQE